MTKTDLAIYELKVTYKQIFDSYQVRPLILESEHPAIGEQIDVISGYWATGYSCGTEFFVHELREENYVMNDSIRYSPGCDTIGGTSGSPVIRAGTRIQIGINNTANEDGEACTMNNPCEVDKNGNMFYKQDLRYGQQTHWVYSCLGEGNAFNLKKEGCQLFH